MRKDFGTSHILLENDVHCLVKKCSHNASITGGGLQKGWAQCSNKGGGWVSQVQGPISGLTDPSWTPEYPTGPLDGQPLEAEYGPDTDFSFDLHYKM